METSKEQIAREVTIDCPVCCSGHHSQLENLGAELTCEDCGFVLAEAHELKAVGSARCVCCGGAQFYFESPLSLTFLGQDSVCYVCAAKYKGVRANHPDGKFNPEVHAQAQQSDASERWRKRVELYNQGAG